AGHLRSGARANGSVAAIASPHLTNEENFRFAQLLKLAGISDVAVAVQLGHSDDLLIKAEKAANARGARDMGLDSTSSVTQILEAAAAGRVSTLYVCGSDVLAIDANLTERALQKVECLIVQDVSPSLLTEQATVVLPSL